jgi:hypothetical protein
MDTNSKQTVLAGFGKLKLARYLVRSYDDLADVCQTVARQLLQYAERDQVFELFNAIECKGTCVPNTLSSVIFGFMVPEGVLQRKGFRSRQTRNPELRVPPTQAPKFECENGQTIFSADVSCFFDLYLLHRFIREVMNLSGEGMKLITSKRMAQMKLTESTSPDTGFGLKIAFPCECDTNALARLETQFLRQALTGS